MSELTALFRLAIQQHRRQFLALALLIGVGELVVLAMVLIMDRSAVDHPLTIDSAIALVVLLSAPAVLWGFLLLDICERRDLNSPASGYDHWLMKLPIKSWKLAAVPIVLKTLWLSGIVLLLIGTASLVASNSISPFLPCIGASTAGVGIFVLVWRPFRSATRRVIALCLFGPILYLLFAGSFATAEASREFAWPAKAGVYLVGMTLYAASVGLAYRSLVLARTSASGVSGANAGWLERFGHEIRLAHDARPAAKNLQPRVHGSSVRALVWHDLAHTWPVIWKTIAFVVVPITLLAWLLPLGSTGAVVLMIAYAIMSNTPTGQIVEASHWQQRTTLPAHLAAAPFSSTKLAWTRLATVNGTCALMLLLSSLALASLLLSPTKLPTFQQWVASLGDSPDVAASTPWLAVRMAATIALAVSAVSLGRTSAYLWTRMSGRTWVEILTITVVCLAGLVPLSVFLIWFLQQGDLAMVQDSLRRWSSLLPSLIAGVLLCKLVAILSAAIKLKTSRLASNRAILSVCAGWLGLTLVVALSLTLLVPDNRVTLLWCVAGSVLAIPLARVLILPVALDWNRHR